MMLNLTFVKEMPAPPKRLYQTADGSLVWIPCGAITGTLRHAAVNGQPERHDVQVANGWLEQNGWLLDERTLGTGRVVNNEGAKKRS